MVIVSETKLTRDEEKRGVHHCGSVKHGGHEDVVTGTVHEAHVTHQVEAARARGPETREAVVLRGAAGYVARRPWTLGVVAFVDLCVGIT